METEQLKATILEQKSINLELIDKCPYPERAARLSITPGKKKNLCNLFCEYLSANCGGETLYLSSVPIDKLINAMTHVKTLTGYDFLLASLEESKEQALRPRQGNLI